MIFSQLFTGSRKIQLFITSFGYLIQENFSKMAKMMLRKYIEAKRQSADAEEVALITDEVLDNVEVNVNQPGFHSPDFVNAPPEPPNYSI